MKDYIIRATAAGGQIRAFVATTKDIVETARGHHNTSPVATAALGRLLTAGTMMGIMMKGDKDVLTLSIKGMGAIGGITVTADSKGRVKGYVNEPMVILPANSMGKLDVRGAIGPGTLSVIKDMGLKEPYIGQIDLVSGEIAEDITYYYAASEQTPSSVALGVLMNKDNTVRAAGGFIIQLMPDTQDEVITKLEKTLSTIKPVTTMLDEGMTPEDILDYLFSDLTYEITEKSDCSFYCNCDKEKVEKALISIGAKELAAIIEDGQPIEMACQFCNSKYEFSIEELKRIYEESK